MEIRIAKKNEINELLEFRGRNEPNHPELKRRDIQDWVNCAEFVAIHNNTIVGCIRMLHQCLKIPSGEVNVGWGNNVILDMSNDKIRKQAGRGLLSAVEKYRPYFGTGMVPGIIEPYKRRGMLIRGDWSNAYALVLKPYKFLTYFGIKRWLAILATPIIKLINLFIKLPEVKKYRIEEIKSFTKNVRWDKYLTQYEMHGKRDEGYLNYKLKQPNKQYKVLVALLGEEQVGYIIYREASHQVKDLNILKICDLVGTVYAKTDLLATVLKQKHNVDAIVAISSVKDKAFYGRMGLYISKDYLVGVQPEYNHELHITFFDSDLDNLW